MRPAGIRAGMEPSLLPTLPLVRLPDWLTDRLWQEINEAAEVIYASADPDANIIFGALFDAGIGCFAAALFFGGVVSAADIAAASALAPFHAAASPRRRRVAQDALRGADVARRLHAVRVHRDVRVRRERSHHKLIDARRRHA